MNFLFLIWNIFALDDHVHKYASDCEICNRELEDATRGRVHHEELFEVPHGLREGEILPSGKRTPGLGEVKREHEKKSNLETAESQAAQAAIEAGEKDLEAKRAERDLADKKKHMAQHDVERAIDEKNRIIIEEKFKPEFVAKKSIPVITFPAHTIPFQAHEMKILDEVNSIRQKNAKEIARQEDLAHLDDITQHVEASKGLEEGPNYDNIVKKVNEETYHVPTDIRNGDYVISGKSVAEHEASTPIEYRVHPERIETVISGEKAKQIADNAHKIGSSFNIFENGSNRSSSI